MLHLSKSMRFDFKHMPTIRRGLQKDTLEMCYALLTLEISTQSIIIGSEQNGVNPCENKRWRNSSVNLNNNRNDKTCGWVNNGNVQLNNGNGDFVPIYNCGNNHITCRYQRRPVKPGAYTTAY
jgi:hypothetical protein